MTKTTIQLEEATRDKLSSLGRKGESYDDIINRVVFKIQKTKEAKRK